MPDVGGCAYPAGMAFVRTFERTEPYEPGFAPSGEEIRQVLGYARAGIERYGYGEELHPADLARPWGNGQWQDNAWLRGVRDVLSWVAGDVDTGPYLGLHVPHPTITHVYDDVRDMDEIMRQGARIPVRPGWPPPQTAEAWDATLDWLNGEPVGPPACEHGGAYSCSCRDLATAALRGDTWPEQLR
jgi:hypothetical protein